MVAKYTFKLNGEIINPPLNWQGLQVVATFDNSSIQANITTEEFEFVNESVTSIKAWLTQYGYFIGMPFTIDAGTVNVFNGFLDFNTYEEISPVKVKCSIRKFNGLNTLDEVSRANSFGYIQSRGYIVASDYINVPYIIERQDAGVEIALLSVTAYMLAVQLQQLVRDLAKNIAILAGIAGAGITGPVSSLVATILITAAELVFAAFVLIQLLKIIKEIASILFPNIKYRKGMTLQRMLEVVANYFGYSLQTNILELSKVVYLPSFQKEDSATLGIPNTRDFGYQVSELFEICVKTFNGKFAILGTELHFHTENDAIWKREASYMMPNVLDERIVLNNSELSARTLISFQTDISDAWTIEEFTGTNYEIIVEHSANPSIQTNLMKGLNDISIPLSLGTRKTKLSALEQTFSAVLGTAIGFINFLGGNLSNPVTNRYGALRLSQKTYNLPKLIILENGKIPTNHRSILGAKAIYERYYANRSFVLNEFGGQKRIFTEKKIPFSFDNFINVLNNSYFYTQSGVLGKINSLKWQLDSDFAIVDYEEDYVYDRNLTERYIEA